MADYRLLVLEINKCGNSKIIKELNCTKSQASNLSNKLNQIYIKSNYVVLAIEKAIIGGVL